MAINFCCMPTIRIYLTYNFNDTRLEADDEICNYLRFKSTGLAVNRATQNEINNV